jgi:hypothetical protein
MLWRAASTCGGLQQRPERTGDVIAGAKTVDAVAIVPVYISGFYLIGDKKMDNPIGVGGVPSTVVGDRQGGLQRSVGFLGHLALVLLEVAWGAFEFNADGSLLVT